MFSVIFEVLPRKENWDDYLENAKMLRSELEPKAHVIRCARRGREDLINKTVARNRTDE